MSLQLRVVRMLHTNEIKVVILPLEKTNRTMAPIEGFFAVIDIIKNNTIL